MVLPSFQAYFQMNLMTFETSMHEKEMFFLQAVVKQHVSRAVGGVGGVGMVWGGAPLGRGKSITPWITPRPAPLPAPPRCRPTLTECTAGLATPARNSII